MRWWKNKRVSGASFTGSYEVGERIAQKANAKKNTRVQLELGGKNPAIVLDDADIDRAVAMIIRAAFGLSGQACTATSRAIVHDKVYDEFTRKLIEKNKENQGREWIAGRRRRWGLL
jgi:acyl-CoA reductase-like NAD-dependent aldehyde dehydrogenase